MWVESRTVIIASGASARWIGLEDERKLIGHGGSSCATCDGFFYRGKKIMVVGGGDSAMEEANFLTRFGEEVTLVHRRDQFRASRIMLDRARANPKIKWLLNTVVDQVYDVEKGSLEAVLLRDVLTREWRQTVDGLFVAIGHVPNTAASGARWSLTPMVSSSLTAVRERTFPACFMPGTCRTAFTGRPSRRPEWAAWRRSKWNASSNWTNNSPPSHRRDRRHQALGLQFFTLFKASRVTFSRPPHGQSSMAIWRFTSLIAMFLLATVAALAADVSGKWAASVQGRNGQARDVTFAFKVDGDKLTGTVSGPGGDSEISDGVINGDEISFSQVREFDGRQIKILYKGEVNGDQIQ